MFAHRAGLSEIAFVPGLMAALSTLITAFWWTPHLWRQSSVWGAVFAASTLAGFVMIQFFTMQAYSDTHGIPSLLTLVLGLGITVWQIRLVLILIKGLESFSLLEAWSLNHLPVFAACILLAARWRLFPRR